MRYKHIIWDYDGTLFNSYPVMATAFENTLKEQGIIEPVSRIISFMKVSMGHAIEHYKEQYQLHDIFFERYKTLSKNLEAENTKPFDGVVELCHAVCKSGGKNYLYTHRSESAIYFLEKYGLMASFAELITSKNNFPRKPSPEAILYLMDKHGFSCDEALMIGDRDLDIFSAKNAGVHTCYFTNRNELSDIAENNISSFYELYRILDIHATVSRERC